MIHHVQLACPAGSENTLRDFYSGVLGFEEVAKPPALAARGVCEACVRDVSNLCAVYDEIGFTRPGALAEHVSVPVGLVHRLGEDVALDDAVLIEPMAVVWRALTRVPLRRGLRVAIVGDGTIALLAVHLVGLFAPATTTVIGRREEQRDLATRAGADSFVIETPSEVFDLVIEAAGSGAAVASAID